MPYNITETVLQEIEPHNLPALRMNRLHPESHFRYAILYHAFTPVDPHGKKSVLPFMVVGLFDYQGKTYASFVGEHSQAPTGRFVADVQQRLVIQSLQALLRVPGIDGAIIAIPEGKTGGKETFHLLTRGHVTDRYRFHNSGNGGENSRSAPVSFVSALTKDARGRYVYYPFVGEELIDNREFCSLCHDVRQLGAQYRQLQPGRKEGTQFAERFGQKTVSQPALFR